jgi:hypothetical protein
MSVGKVEFFDGAEWVPVSSTAEFRPQFEPGERCTVPPDAWVCTRVAGHDGPCAAWPAERRRLRLYIDLRDWWIGYYRADRWHYVCLLPCVVLRWPRRGGSDVG